MRLPLPPLYYAEDSGSILGLSFLWHSWVQTIPRFLHLQNFFVQSVWQLQVILSSIASDMGALLIMTGIRSPSSFSIHPLLATGEVNVEWFFTWAYNRREAWWKALHMWKYTASLVGGFSSGLLEERRVLTRILSSVSACGSWYSRQINISAFS